MKLVFVCGDEPYMVDKAVREAAGDMDWNDINCLRCDEFNEEVESFISTYPFF